MITKANSSSKYRRSQSFSSEAYLVEGGLDNEERWPPRYTAVQRCRQWVSLVGQRCCLMGEAASKHSDQPPDKLQLYEAQDRLVMLSTKGTSKD